MQSSIKPSPIALVVCDDIYHGDGTGKAALVGLFNTVSARSFPVKHGRLCVYVSVTDVRPNSVFEIDIVHGETSKPVVAMKGPPPPNTQPTTICDLMFVLENVTFPEPGRYYIRFFGNGHILLQRPFEVTRIE